MKKNMGNSDRLIRVAIAIVLIILKTAGIVSGTWGTVLVIFAGVLILTSLISFCPMYLPFGLNTCKNNKA
ncbi:MAG: DUF2892 domain-containing protein [Bacteroidia bacterium]|nr:DUF2892 domain-containing protein [Bacteroidia bacterium]